MAKKFNYKYFRVFTMITSNDSSVLDLMFDNLRYRDALKQFKVIRESLEESISNFTTLTLLGITDDDSENVIRQKSFEPQNVTCIESNESLSLVNESSTDTGIEIITDVENIDIETKSEKLDDYSESIDDYSEFISSSEPDEFVSIGDLLSDLSISINSADFKKTDCDEVTLDNPTSSNFNDVADNCLECDSANDASNNVSTLNEKEIVVEKEIDYLSTQPKTLKDLNLTDFYSHIGDVDTKDIVNVLLDVLLLLDKKHNHNMDIVNLVEKKRDCLYHNFENFDKTDFVSLQSEDSYLASLGRKMHDLSKIRREAKEGYLLTEKVFNNLSKVRLSNYSAISSLNKPKAPFDVNAAPNIKVYTFNYSNEAERVLLLKTLPDTFDKVIDVTWGLIECYNKIGSNKAKKLSNVKDVESKIRVSILDGLSIKKYESIVDQTVPFGKSFLKTKGTSVKITNMNTKNVNALINTIHNKYSKFAYHSGTESFYLINRL